VLLLALLPGVRHETLAHANAGKNVLLGVANGVAALVFIVLAPVQWLAVVPLGLGCLLGSRLGPFVVRHAPSGRTEVLADRRQRDIDDRGVHADDQQAHTADAEHQKLSVTAHRGDLVAMG
jgi:hypothetical protein